MALTIQEAAYLMGMSVETIKKMIENGKLLTIKLGRSSNEPVLINESEMSRFQHPWEHVYRIDQRVNSLQELVEILKGKINEQSGMVWRSDLQDHRMEIDALKEGMRRIDKLIVATIAGLEGIRNEVKGLQAKVNRKHRRKTSSPS